MRAPGARIASSAWSAGVTARPAVRISAAPRRTVAPNGSVSVPPVPGSGLVTEATPGTAVRSTVAVSAATAPCLPPPVR